MNRPHTRHIHPRENSVVIHKTCRALLLLPVCMLLVGTQTSWAGPSTNYTWDGGGADDNWNTSSNWNPNTTPTFDSNANLQFAGSTRTAPVNNLAGTTNLRSIAFNAGASSFTLSGNAVNITNAAGIANNSTNLQTISLSGITLGASAFSLDATSGEILVNSVLSGGNGFDVTGTRVTLAGTNLHTGANTVTSGVLRITNGSALGTIANGTTVSSGAALELQGGITTLAEALVIEGTGISSGGALRNISGNNTYAGAITIANATGVHRINSDSGLLTIGAGGITESGNSDNKDLTFGGAGDITVSGNITAGAGDMRLFKDGSGTLTLSGTNTYDGTTTISGGVLSVGTIGNGGVSGNLGAATNAAANLVLNNGTLQYTGATASTNRSFTITAGATGTFDITANNLTISGASAVTTGALTKTGAGTLTLSGANGHTGLTTVSAGTLAYGVNNALSSGAVTVSGGILNIGTFSDTVGAVTLSGGSINGTTGVLTATSFSMQSGSVSAILGGAIALNKTTAGNVTLSGANAYTGGTSITAGTLLANNTSGSATGTGAVSVGASGRLGGTGTIAPTGTNGINVSGVLAPGASIGTLTLNMSSTTGTVTMNSGSSFEFELGLPGGSINSVGTSDLVALAGAGASDFAFANNVVDFLGTGDLGFYKLFDTSSNNANTWTGLTFDGTTGLVTSGLAYTNLAGTYSGAFFVGTSSNGGNLGDIYFQVVPEPRAALLGGLGTLLLLRRRRAA